MKANGGWQLCGPWIRHARFVTPVRPLHGPARPAGRPARAGV